MAKTATVTNNKVKPKNEVAPTKKSTAVAVDNTDIMAAMAGDAGAGVSTASEDNIVPLLYVLQAQSPQAIKGNKAEYVAGAEGGDLWLRGTKTIFKGGDGDGVLAQPCHFSKVWIEWQPNRGGFVARHKERPKVAEQKALDPNKPDRMTWVMPNGNTVAETREHVVRLFDDELNFICAVVAPFTGSNHGASRAWMGLMNDKTVPGPDGKKVTAPSYGFLYRMRTVFRTNDDGDWYMYSIGDAGEEGQRMMVPSMDEYEAGQKIFKDFNAGALRADNPVDESTESSEDGI